MATTAYTGPEFPSYIADKMSRQVFHTSCQGCAACDIIEILKTDHAPQSQHCAKQDVLSQEMMEFRGKFLSPMEKFIARPCEIESASLSAEDLSTWQGLWLQNFEWTKFCAGRELAHLEATKLAALAYSMEAVERQNMINKKIKKEKAAFAAGRILGHKDRLNKLKGQATVRDRMAKHARHIYNKAKEEEWEASVLLEALDTVEAMDAYERANNGPAQALEKLRALKAAEARNSFKQTRADRAALRKAARKEALAAKAQAKAAGAVEAEEETVIVPCFFLEMDHCEASDKDNVPEKGDGSVYDDSNNEEDASSFYEDEDDASSFYEEEVANSFYEEEVASSFYEDEDEDDEDEDEDDGQAIPAALVPPPMVAHTHTLDPSQEQYWGCGCPSSSRDEDRCSVCNNQALVDNVYANLI